MEYVLWRVLHMDYYELSNPAACQAALAEYKEANDPLRQFIDEIFPRLAWDIVPLSYLYDLYRAWMEQSCPGGRMLNKGKFRKEIIKLQADIPGWTCPERDVQKYVGQAMSKPEPLTREFNLLKWTNPACPDTKSPNWLVPVQPYNVKGCFIRTNAQPPVKTT